MSQELNVVTYHYVRDPINTRFSNFKTRSVDEFRNQLDYIESNYNVITMEQAIDALYGGTSLPKNSMLLTFDDGYVDHFNVVFPLLVDRGWQGTFFIPTDAVFNRKLLAVNKIHMLLSETQNNSNLLYDIYDLVDEYRDNYHIDSREALEAKYLVDGRYDDPAVSMIKKLLQNVLPKDIREEIISKLFEKHIRVDEATLGEEMYMTIDQLKVMNATNMYIGNHGFSHQWLDSLTYAEQKFDILKSLKLLEEITVSRRNWAMCYPYGAYDSNTQKILEDNGCAVAFTTRGEKTILDNEHKYSLPRFDTNQIQTFAEILQKNLQ